MFGVCHCGWPDTLHLNDALCHWDVTPPMLVRSETRYAGAVDAGPPKSWSRDVPMPRPPVPVHR